MFNEIKESNKSKDKEGRLIDNEYCFYFSLEDKGCHITINDLLLQ
ncbi:hypothetical protein [Wolbachia endosymbiont of Litomosoides brasiliensis]|nr:hypothetical protein [Wolbachia endosymbiont of Litomosoides brasiliensis]